MAWYRSARSSRGIQGALCALLLVVVALVYMPGRNGGFAFDDYPNFVNNPAVHVTTLSPAAWLSAASSSPSRSLPRPLAMASFAANHYFTGGEAVPMKLTNILIHVLNTLLVFLLVRRLARIGGPPEHAATARPGWFALAVAAAWGLHPINMMPVLLIVQRMESLSHVFVFAGLIAYLAGRERQRQGRSGVALLALAFVVCPMVGCLAKESAALLPLYCLIAENCLFQFETVPGQRDRRLVRAHLALVVLPALLAFAWLLHRSLLPGAFFSRDFNLPERLMTEARIVFDYLHWIVLPNLRELSLYHDDYVVSRGLLQPATTLLGLVAAPLIVALAVYLRRWRPLVSLGVLWFFAAQLLTATVVPLELVFEHRNYFASLGVLLALADLALHSRTGKTRRVGWACAFAALLVLSFLTSLRVREWSDPIDFARTEAKKNPNSPRAMYYLGWVLTVASGYRADSPMVEQALDAFARARALPDANALADSGALIVAERTHRPLQRAWWEHMQHRLATGPLGPQETGAVAVMVTCDIKRVCHFPPDQMLATFGAALSQGPHAEFMNIYGNYVWNIAGDRELALRLWRESMRMNPNEAQYHIAVIKALTVLGRKDEARQEIARFRTLGRFGVNAPMADKLEKALGKP
jgi:tetratricopeptide (TPR) repeat protein